MGAGVEEDEGAGDWDRDDVGGPFDQADFDGSWGGFFGTVAVEDLLILRHACCQSPATLQKGGNTHEFLAKSGGCCDLVGSDGKK